MFIFGLKIVIQVGMLKILIINFFTFNKKLKPSFVMDKRIQQQIIQ